MPTGQSTISKAVGHDTGGAPARRSERLYWLDALRGIAALSVVLGHYFWGMVNVPGHAFFDPGLFGVAVFFLISGYIVPLSVRDEPDAAWWFALARFFRLYPLYWVSLAIGVAVYSPSVLQAAVNVTMVQRFLGVGDVINVYWTLQIELLFYAIVIGCILARSFNRTHLVMSFALLFAVLSTLFAFARLHYQVKAPLSVPIGLTCIFVGNLKSLVDTGHLSRHRFYACALIVTGLLTWSFYLGYSQDWGHDERPERFVVSYALAVVVYVTLSRLRARRNRLLEFLGAISYPMYLVHQPILEVTTRLLPDYSPSALRFISLPLVLLVAYSLHRTVEKYFVRLGRQLAGHRPVAPAVAEVSGRFVNRTQGAVERS
jgi:peptidoglycan/LPS O-acetylase OafA/YrhL